MNTPILTLRLRGKRQLVLARQYARQIAGLLGFDPELQVEIAARVFELALEARTKDSRSRLQFHVTRESLKVFLVKAQSQRELAGSRMGVGCRGLSWPLPSNAERVANEDLVWLLKKLTEVTPMNVFEELERQNHAYLEVLHELRACQRALEAARHSPTVHVAA